MSSTIRKAQDSDLPVLMHLTLRTMRQCYGPFMGETVIEEYILTGATEQYLKDNVQNCHVLLLGDSIIGLAVCKGHVLDLLMIDPDYHRRGFGQCLMLAMEDRLFRAHARIELESYKKNTNAIGFYRHTGWKAEDTFVDPESGQCKIRFAKLFQGASG